jgi:excisionase family DNA binding protein
MQTFMPQKMLPELVTVPEAARYLGIGRKEVYRLLDFGELRATRQNGRVLIDSVSIYEMCNRGKLH